MVGLAFVETYLGAALHLGIEQPFDDKQCPFDPPDFAQRKCQVVLSRSRRQFLEEMTGLHPAGEHGCNAAQNIWPIGDDGGFADAVARQRVSVLLCMTDLAHASKLKEHDDNDDFQGTTGRAA